MLVGGLDLESTGLLVDQDRICEIAVVVHDELGQEKLRYRRLINPTVHLTPKLVAIHGITDADVMNAPIFAKEAPAICALLDKLDILVMHNGKGFDAPMLIHEIMRTPIRVKRMPAIFDTMLQGRWATADGKVPTLGELCWSLDVPYDPALAHAALYDVSCMMACFWRGIALGHWKISEILP